MENNLSKERLNLLSESSKPVPYNKRTVGPFSLTSIWFGMAVQIVIFMVAGQLYPSLSVGQILIALILGNTIPALVVYFTQELGIKYGLNFSVVTRIMFGYKGSLYPSYLRAIPAIFWFGFQTWIGSSALNEISVLLFGYSNELLFYLIFGALQILTTFYGISFIKVMNVIASPVLLIMGIIMASFLIIESGLSISEIMVMGGDGTGSFMWGTMAFVGGWVTLSCSIQDIVKDCKVTEDDQKNWTKTNIKYCASQWIGMVPASVLFGFIGVLCMALAGEWNPVIAITKIIGSISIILAIFFQLFVFIATWTTNAAANLLNPAFVLSSTFPKNIDFKKGVFIAGIIGLAMVPWKLADYLSTYMNFLGSALGPIAGIIITDYILLRNREISLVDLYDSKGTYSYWNGVNWGAIITAIVSVIVSFLFPNVMFLVGMFVSIILYYFIMKNWVFKKFPLDLKNLSYNDKFLDNDI